MSDHLTDPHRPAELKAAIDRGEVYLDTRDGVWKQLGFPLSDTFRAELSRMLRSGEASQDWSGEHQYVQLARFWVCDRCPCMCAPTDERLARVYPLHGGHT